MPQIEKDLTLEMIAKRVADNKASFEKKFKTRKAKQDNYYENKERIIEGTPEATSIDMAEKAKADINPEEKD